MGQSKQSSRVALEKLQYYVTTRVDDMLTQGEEVTARVYYQRLEFKRLFLRTGAESVALLGRKVGCLQICRRRGEL